MIKKYFAMSIIAASVAMSACSDDDDDDDVITGTPDVENPDSGEMPGEETPVAPPAATPGEGSSAFDEVFNSADHGTLSGLIASAGLADTLDDPDGRFTIFAPNDAAFTALEQSDPDTYAAVTADTPEGKALLARVLKHHVLAGTNESQVIIDGVSDATTLNEGRPEGEADVLFSVATLADAAPAQSVEFDINAEGTGYLIYDGQGTEYPLSGPLDVGRDETVGAPQTGIVHVLDVVLMPEAVADVENPPVTPAPGGGGDPSDAAGALQAILNANEDGAYEIFRNTDGIVGNEAKIVATEDANPWTVFAPTDAALGATPFMWLDHVVVLGGLNEQELVERSDEISSQSGKSMTFLSDGEGGVTLNGHPITLMNAGATYLYRIDGVVE